MSDRILVATRKGLFTLERKSREWAVAQVDFLGDNVSAVLADARDGSLYAGLEHGHFGVKLHRSEGAGKPWQECAAPAYPKQPEGETDTDGMGKPIPWNTVKLWTLEAGGADEPGLLWCGTIPGGLFRSIDKGASWELVRTLWDHPKRKEWFGGGADLPGIHSICVDPRASRTVRIAVSCGGVWVTKDGGASWACCAEGMWAAYMPPERRNDPNIQDVHRLAQCRQSPDRLWVQHHNGIFHSRDGALSWQEAGGVEPSNFGFAVAVHPQNPDVAWFVPAIKDEQRVPVGGALVVTRTRDGGRTFEALRNGLPQRHAYDLVYRHGLDVDATGDRLVIGSTTGGLWVSDDQGQSWGAVAARFPPIHYVRFVP
ncbi:MAG TPA: hypothetical protein VNK52_08145 [Hyphomicrobiaceae bacterium]|nr:hypothetical protein [Hyphomicrobiaceae bacterium]